MKKTLLLTFLSFLLTNLIGQTMNLPIVPKPQQVNYRQGKLQLKEDLVISVNTDSAEAGYSAEQIKNSLLGIKVNSSIINGKKGFIILTVDKNLKKDEKNFNEEGYTLSVNSDGIKIEAPTLKGLFYGTMSLVQLLDKAKDKTIPFVEVVDWPDMKIRGISDDISRGQVSTLNNFKKIIDNISRYKMNTYMPYLEDMIQFDAYPTIGKNRGALTKEEIRELVTYAKKHFVEVIPIFQTLGHYENLLSQQEFLKYAEFPGAASLNISNDSTYIFLEALLKEVFELFPSKYFHMGADESFDVGLGKSKYLVDESDIATVHANHYKKIYNICKKYGKKVLMYGDIILRHPSILSQIPKDITIVDWHYRADYDYPSTRTFKDAGFNYFVSPASWNFLTTFPTNVNAIPNIKYIIKSGLENGSEGMINSNWGDYGAETFKRLILFDYAWSAECSWNFKGSDQSEFTKNYFSDFFGTNDERFAEVYETLSNPFNQMMWHEVWRHPLLDFRAPVWWEANMSRVGKISWMNWTLPNTLKKINELQKEATKNKDHFDILRFIIKLDDWYKLKLNTQLMLHDSVQLANNAEEILSNIDENISELKKLEKEYSDIWLQYYKKDNLNMIQDKFERLISYFEETKAQVKENPVKLASPLISSSWIYVAKDDTGKKNLADKAEFKRVINLNQKPEHAYLQLMGDTYARLFINGEYVDEVFARRSLSLLVDYKRIKFLDVSKFLKKEKI